MCLDSFNGHCGMVPCYASFPAKLIFSIRGVQTTSRGSNLARNCDQSGPRQRMPFSCYCCYNKWIKKYRMILA